MPRKSLPEQFPVRTKTELLPFLRSLLKALEGRFASLEAQAPVLDAAIDVFNNTALQRINDVITPLVTNATASFQDIANAFRTTSTTNVTIDVGEQALVIADEDRNHFVPIDYAVVRSIANPDNAMLGRVISLDRNTGDIIIDVTDTTGAGTFNDWEIIAATNPDIGQMTSAQVMELIDSVETDIDTLHTTVEADIDTKVAVAIDTLTGVAPVALNTLVELAAALANDPNFAATMTTALGNRIRVDAAQAFTLAQKRQALANNGVIQRTVITPNTSAAVNADALVWVITAPLTAPRALTLPLAAGFAPGTPIKIIDEAGGSVGPVNTLTLNRQIGTELINNVLGSFVVDFNFRELTLRTDGNLSWTLHTPADRVSIRVSQNLSAAQQRTARQNIAIAGRSSVRGLTGNNSSGSASQFTSEEVVLRDAAGDIGKFMLNPGTIIVDMALAGPALNGRDQVGAFPVNAWMHFYYIWGAGLTFGGIVSLAAPTGAAAPALPVGYTHWAYSHSIYRTAGGTLAVVSLRGNWVWYRTGSPILITGVQTVETPVTIAGTVPPNATAILMQAQLDVTAAVGIEGFLTAQTKVSAGEVFHTMKARGHTSIPGYQEENILLPYPPVGTNLFYQLNSASGTPQLSWTVLGYQVANGGG